MTEPVAGPSGPGTVVMNVGGDIGALILYTPAEMDGQEIEISRDDAPEAKGTHSQVRARHMPGGTRYAAVYPGLRSGSYTLWADAEQPAVSVVVAGGEVASCSWPYASA
jgi:hypothetical protein